MECLPWTERAVSKVARREVQFALRWHRWGRWHIGIALEKEQAFQVQHVCTGITPTAYLYHVIKVLRPYTAPPTKALHRTSRHGMGPKVTVWMAGAWSQYAPWLMLGRFLPGTVILTFHRKVIPIVRERH
jgi:hypothetical protein